MPQTTTPLKGKFVSFSKFTLY